jgi:repressor LexA
MPTDRERQVLEFLRAYTRQHGYAPKLREIAEHLNISSRGVVHRYLKALEHEGIIAIERDRSRGIRLTEEAGLPVVGRVAAGSPILAVEHIEDHYQVDPRLFSPRADYLLRVQGMSMREAGILDGDLLAVHKTPEAKSGEIVVARIEEEVTVKRLERRGARVRLLPENPEFEPIEIDLRRTPLVIEGIGVGVIRPRSQPR